MEDWLKTMPLAYFGHLYRYATDVETLDAVAREFDRRDRESVAAAVGRGVAAVESGALNDPVFATPEAVVNEPYGRPRFRPEDIYSPEEHAWMVAAAAAPTPALTRETTDLKEYD